MKLSFPNPSRNFDVSRNSVCFWGYDNAIEVSFFVETEALKLLCPDMSSEEPEFLQAFDKALKRIHKVANNVYVRGGTKGTYAYTFVAKDF